MRGLGDSHGCIGSGNRTAEIWDLVVGWEDGRGQRRRGSGEERDLAIKIKNKREAFMGL